MKIGLLDHMGYGNLGDAATQDALIANIKSRLPEAQIVGFSLNPNDTQRRHQIPCYSITHWYPGLDRPAATASGASNPRTRLKLLLKKIPVFSPVVRWTRNLLRELIHLGRSFKAIRSLDSLIIAGGGQLSELWRGPWSHPYNVFKFALLTKLANRRLLFLNVGAGPLDSRLGRAFVKYSVDLADYVSFRDVESQALVQQLGVRRKTKVFPDSVYALDLSSYETIDRSNTSDFVVGINPIGFCDPRIWPRQDLSVYSRYLDKMTEVSSWLLHRNFKLKFFSGDASVDVYALEHLKQRLGASLSRDISEMFVAPSETVKDLFIEMSGVDFVITSKFHGVIFSHLLTKPVIALSYGRKIDNLMRTIGHSQYCLPIEGFDVECLKSAFDALTGDVQILKSKFRQLHASYSEALKAQFDDVFIPRNAHLYAFNLGDGAEQGDSRKSRLPNMGSSSAE